MSLAEYVDIQTIFIYVIYPLSEVILIIHTKVCKPMSTKVDTLSRHMNNMPVYITDLYSLQDGR